MKVYELKKHVEELLKSKIDPLKTPREIIGFISKLVEILEPLEDKSEFYPGMMPPVKNLIDQFWYWVVGNVPYEQWKEGTYVIPWLSLQRLLVKEGLLAADFHHPVLYEALKNQFNHLAGNRLKITELMPLLIRAGRMLGYMDPTENGYPFVRLHAGIAARMPQEITKIKDIMFLLRSAFYLIYKYCTVEQLTLMPFLIYFRNLTTDEERRSELAIFNYLTQNTADCIEFFNTYDEYIDTRSITLIDALQNVSAWMPTKRPDFLNATNRSRWIYPFIQQVRLAAGDDLGNDLINSTLHLLELDFATRKDQSFTGALSFTAAVKRQAQVLTNEEAKLVHSATCLFCLEKYIKHRVEDPLGDKHSFLSLSGETKCHAAEKRMSAILGRPTRFGFFETLAINQGRLKKLIDFLEESPEKYPEDYIVSI
ncbi:hypothetical protein LEAN103870_10285 [Legionella anisa]|uniref:Uncharacterized protein n=1 Tax=Legionella anisa TaxID=28082 RepID=A0AAX0WVI2_9GAMM|nr:hypothetical protein [Legionella anisa]AWN73648.1 hypothetical protein DLD14_07250 [Legionella anisa]KTC75764.1 hypothetical protein Lani_0587 [Legionella anisa]MBN5935598.1 hypothetical protein [Legionella anisa]MCW8426541.1 hypothetical protein [Legionella anisa]MCW8448204.1 hypothetical protein [Legionella anisa]